MLGQIGTFLQAGWERVSPLVCGSDAGVAASLGLSEWQFAAAKASLFVFFLIPVLLAWRASWPRLKRNGFAKPVWRTGLWLIGAVTAFQVAEILLQPLTGPVISCPSDLVGLALVSALVLYGLYCFHLGRGNKGSFSRFMVLIAGPLFGEAAVGSREIGISGAKVVVRSVDFLAELALRAHALVHV